MRLIGGQFLAHGLDKNGIVGGYAETLGLQELPLDLEVKSGR